MHLDDDQEVIIFKDLPWSKLLLSENYKKHIIKS
jgi:hypothetical protein